MAGLATSEQPFCWLELAWLVIPSFAEDKSSGLRLTFEVGETFWVDWRSLCISPAFTFSRNSSFVSLNASGGEANSDGDFINTAWLSLRYLGRFVVDQNI